MFFFLNKTVLQPIQNVQNRTETISEKNTLWKIVHVNAMREIQVKITFMLASTRKTKYFFVFLSNFCFTRAAQNETEENAKNSVRRFPASL